MINVGIITLYFDEDGRYTSGNFVPEEMKIDSASLHERLPFVDGVSQTSMSKSVEVIVSSWFQRMNDMELADRDKYELTTEVVKCEEWPSGSVRKCILSVHLKSIFNATNN